MGYTDENILDSDEGIKLGYTGGKMLVTILVNLDRIKPGLDIGTELGSLYGSFDGSNY